MNALIDLVYTMDYIESCILALDPEVAVMHSIEVDFEVLKALMTRRTTEEVSYNDVIRDLLKLGAKPPAPRRAEEVSAKDWIVKGVRFPVGTEFRSRHNGQLYNGHVDDGALLLNGKRYHSPSAAGVSITGYAVNGWMFWECRLPGGDWRSMATYRKGANA
jgi:hypothetical protein